MSSVRLVLDEEQTRGSSIEDPRVSSLMALRGLGVLLLDRESTIVACNDAAAQIIGLAANEVVGKHPGEAVELRSNGVVMAAAQIPSQRAFLAREAHDGGVVEVRQHAGDRRWVRVEAVPLVDEHGVVERILVTMIDVTSSHDVAETLRTERRRLARAGDRFRRVLESVPDAIAVYHDQGFGYANAALITLLGYGSSAELVGKEVTRVLPGHAPWARSDAAKQPGLREESWRRLDGTIAIVEIATHGIDLDGAEGTLLIARDITERKRAQRELVQSTRLASVGTLAAGVAHEINNPLTYVIANLDLLVEALQVPRTLTSSERMEEVLSMADDARLGAESVRKIVRGLKAFSRADEERRVSLDVCRVIDLSVEMASNEIRHRARLVKEYGPVPRIDADEGRLGQVFINLLVNAAQAIPEGHVNANVIRVVTATDGMGRAVIEIHDTGEGIPQEVLERIFDPFFTTKPIGVGTGLGLSICHGLIAELGGELRVESEVGKGTIFRVTVPPTAVDLPRSDTPSVIAAQAPSRRARVLVVDDDAAVAEAVRRVLAREHDVVVVDSGKKGLERIAEDARFDIVLCDLMMPEMTGMSFYGHLLTVAPPLAARVVFMTGGAFSAGAGAFLDEVPNQRVDKPFDFVTLRAVVSAFAPTID